MIIAYLIAIFIIYHSRRIKKLLGSTRNYFVVNWVMRSDEKRIISLPECRKMYSWESKFSRFSMGECPQTSLGAQTSGPCHFGYLPTSPQMSFYF